MSSSSAGGSSQFSSLRAWDILANLPDPRYQAYVRLAAHLFDAAFGIIALRQPDGSLAPAVFHGLDAQAISQTPIFTDPAIMAAGQPMVVENMSVDIRFSQDVLVTGTTNARFCIALPLFQGKDMAAGVLWILDRRPRNLAQNDLYRLTEFALCLSQTLQMRHEVEGLARDALTDSLTGLANRAAMECQLDCAIENTPRNNGLTVLSIRSDRLQTVNGLFGFAGGNQMLRDMGRRLQEDLAPDMILARLGGAEFALLLPEMDDIHEAGRFASRVLKRLSQPIVIGGQSLSQNISVGFALYPHHGTTATTLLNHAADTSWAENSPVEEGPEMVDAPIGFGDHQAVHPLQDDLKYALQHDQFYLYWQPIADGESRQSIAYEALLRWDRPGFGPVPPQEFTSAAEQCGLGAAMDAWVLHAACKEAATWPDRTLRAAVNVSCHPANLAGLPDAVASALQVAGLHPARLEIEIAEQVLIEDEVAVRNAVSALHQLGVRVVLDNFSCSLAAMDCLRDLPVDKLKLDRGLTREVISDLVTRDKVRDTVKLSSMHGFIVLAQGVESEEQLASLRSLGCDQMQGYLLGWPRPVVALPDEQPSPSLQRA